MNQLKIAVCDDHVEDSQLLVSLIRQYADVNHYYVEIDVFASGEEFLKVDCTDYRLVFMDIYMANLTGMDTARAIYKDNKRTKIVFCSSSSDFGVESYDVDALGYILKPATKDKVYMVLDRFFEIFSSMRSITVKVNRVDEVIYLQDIIWIEANRNQCIIHMKDQDVVTRSAFSQLCEQFPKGDFVKPIRYALVSLKEIVKVPAETVLLSSGDAIPVAKDSRESLKNAYMDFLWKQAFSGKRGL